MVEHLVIGDLGTLLLVLGLTGPVLAPVLRIGFFDRLRVLAHPLVAFPLWAVNLYLWHVPVLPRGGACATTRVHALQHFAFVALRLQHVDGAARARCPSRPGSATSPRLGYIIAVRLTGAVLGNVFVFGGHVFFGVYAAGERAHGISPGGRPERRRARS